MDFWSNGTGTLSACDHSLEKIILMNYLKRFGRFELASEGLIRKSPMYFKSVVAIIKAKLKKLNCFTRLSKTNFTLLLLVKQPQKSFMGELIATSLLWGSLPGKIHLKERFCSDVMIAKNYLNQEEVSKLNRLVNMFIDFAELRALNQQIMTMKDWLKQIEKFLNYTDQQILRHAEQISHSMALAKAEEEYEKYRVQGDKEYLSDFDRELAKYLKGNAIS